MKPSQSSPPTSSASVPSRPTHLAQDLRRTATLAVPLVLGHLSAGLIGFIDNVIAGQHGTNTLAGSAIGTAVFWLAMALPMGTLMVLPPSVAQLDGANRRAQIAPLFRQALWLALGMGLVLAAILGLAEQAFNVMGIDPQIQPTASAFVAGIRWGMPALSLYFCLRYLSDGLHWTLPTMVFGFGGVLALLPLGWALTFGVNSGWIVVPQMGAYGLGLASSIMLWLQALAFGWYLARARRFADLHLFSRFEPPRWPVIAGLLKTGLPIGVTVAMEGGLFILTALLLGRMGEVPVAAHQIAINVSSLFFMIPFGIAEATTVRVGHAVGRGLGTEGVRRAARASLALVLMTQTVSAVLLLLGHDAIVRLYTTDATVMALASTLLLFAAAYQFPDGVQVLSAGALRGLKDTRVPMLLALFAYWCVGMPLVVWLGLDWGWGAKGMWLGLIAGLTCAALLLATRFWRSSRKMAVMPVSVND